MPNHGFALVRQFPTILGRPSSATCSCCLTLPYVMLAGPSSSPRSWGPLSRTGATTIFRGTGHRSQEFTFHALSFFAAVPNGPSW